MTDTPQQKPWPSDKELVARLERLGRELRRLAADIAAAEYRWLVVLEEFDRGGGWALEGAKSCAGWLSWACGLDLGAARERLRVARALPSLPLVSEAFAAGTLSYSKVRAITRAATSENEELLVTYAGHATAAQLEAVVRGYRRSRRAVEAAEPPEEGSEELAYREHRRAYWYVDDEGYVRIDARLPADDGMVVVRALEALATELGEQPADVPDDPVHGTGDRPVALKRWQTPEPSEVRLADALRVAAEQALANGSGTRDGEDLYTVTVVMRAEPPKGAAPPKGAEPPKGAAPPYVPGAETLLPGERALPPDPPAYVAGGPALVEETALRIACDASVVALVEDALGNPLGVGRKTRTPPRWVRRALKRRDRGCRFPGCGQTRHLDAHHIWHWSLGGPTELDNLVLLCRFHHTLVHEGGFSISFYAPGRFVFHRPDGSVVETVAPPERGDAGRLAAENRAAGTDPTPDNLIPMWDGTRQDIDAAVEVLHHTTHGFPGVSPRDVSAETRTEEAAG